MQPICKYLPSTQQLHRTAELTLFYLATLSLQLLRSLATGTTGQSSNSASHAVTAASLPASTLSHPLPNQSLPPPAIPAQAATDSGSAQDAAKASAPAQWIDSKSQISSDSLVETFTRVGERTTIKRSVVGRACAIGKNVKLTGVIVMDGVKIGDK